MYPSKPATQPFNLLLTTGVYLDMHHADVRSDRMLARRRHASWLGSDSKKTRVVCNESMICHCSGR